MDSSWDRGVSYTGKGLIACHSCHHLWTSGINTEEDITRLCKILPEQSTALGWKRRVES